MQKSTDVPGNSVSQLEHLVVGGLPIVCLGRNGFANLLRRDHELQVSSGRGMLPKVSFSVNGQVISEVPKSKRLLDLYMRADYLDADGMWVVFASKLLSFEPLQERVATTDFFHDAVAVAIETGMSFFLLGGTRENNDAVVAHLSRRYPRLKIAGARHGYFRDDDLDEVVQDIKDAKADVVWVGMGYPRQELVAEYLASRLVGVTWIKTCGGLYEHVLGLHPRAPLWIQKIGFEWFHRMVQEPRRLGRRYLLSNPVALWRLLIDTERRRIPYKGGARVAGG